MGSSSMESTSCMETRNLRASNASLTDGGGSNCALAQHQYHYIQYPAFYQNNNAAITAALLATQQQQQQQQLQQQQQFGASMSQCQCPCSCGGGAALAQQQQQQQQRMQQSQQQQQQDGQMAVAVIVHHQQPLQASSTESTSTTNQLKSQSAQSLLNHSYQALHVDTAAGEHKRLNICDDAGAGAEGVADVSDGGVGAAISCDCDLECTCGVAAAAAAAAVAKAAALKHKQSNLLADAMLGVDEITVSESDNNSTMIKKKKPRAIAASSIDVCCTRSLPEKNCNEIYHDTELVDSVDYCLKSRRGSIIGNEDNRPPLPPRPPQRPRGSSVAANAIAVRHGSGIKKYVVWCLICGGFSCLLGVLFLGVYFMLHSYTISVGNFETVPTFVPATLLILTGGCVMSLARRRNRYSYLIKLSGACGIVSALTCALVTVTTTVLHMSRLQALRECEYAQKTRTCTCYSDMVESTIDRVDKGVRLVFDSLSDCGVVHGSLYSCLRAIFGLSVAGVLVAVFSCMLVYQLLSHERKKMYWEQLELRCRSLYASQVPPANMAAMAAAGRMVNCRCCEQCHAHRQLQLPLQAAAYPWDEIAAVTGTGAGAVNMEQRFWATQPPGNFYSPNPGGEEPLTNCRAHNASNERTARSTGWSWPRMPWQRNTPDSGRRFRQAAASPDSQYGFSNSNDGNMLIEEQHVPQNTTSFNAMAPNAMPYGVWGPPPPYSDPNSPARRGYYQYLQPSACLNTNGHVTHERASVVPCNANIVMESRLACQHQSGVAVMERDEGDNMTNCLPPTANTNATGNCNRNTAKRQHGSNTSKSKAAANAGDYENTHSDSDACGERERERCVNTLPTRKLKKRIEAGAKSIGPQNQASQRPNVQQVFANTTPNGMGTQSPATIRENIGGEQLQPQTASTRGGANVGGVENNAYQCSADSNCTIAPNPDSTESEVYFADVSSCCNMSVKNDNYYEDASSTPHRQHHHQHQHSNCSHSSSNQSNANTNSSSNNEDYLAQRFGRREHSIRSRLPFPQSRHGDDYESSNLNMPTVKGAALEQQQQQLQKEISRQSMCSVESEAKTEFTDLSPLTPCSSQMPPPPANFASDAQTLKPVEAQSQQQPANFVATFAYSADSQSLEAHRRSTKNIHEMLLAGSDSHYEVINDRYNQQQSQSSASSQATTSTPQRPTNLHGNGNANAASTLSHKGTPKGKSRSREHLDSHASSGFQAAEREWSDGGGGGAGRSKRL